MELRIPVPDKIAHTPTIPISPNTLASRNAQRKLEEGNRTGFFGTSSQIARVGPRSTYRRGSVGNTKSKTRYKKRRYSRRK